MASVAGAFLVGGLLFVLGLYLTFGPMAANQDENVTTPTTEAYSLPSWFFFPVGVPTTVSWSEVSPPDTVSVQPCQSVSDGTCVGPGETLASGTGSSGSFTFDADEGQTYGVNVSSPGVLTISIDFTGAYGILLFLVYTCAVVCVALAFMYNFQRGSRYAPI
jgi:hypothetical protein